MSPEEYAAAQREARSHAGGVIRAESRVAPEEEPPPLTEPQPDPALPAPVERNPAAALPMAIVFSDTPSNEENGLIWKCVSRVAKVWNPITGQPAEVTEEMIDQSVASFGRAYPYVDIPLAHKLDAPELNTGFVRKLEKRIVGGDIQMWALLDFTEPEIKQKVANRTIADVSAWFDSDLVDQRSGAVVYPWAVRHVCLTNKPLMLDQGAFSADQHLVVRDEKAVWFSVVEPSVQEERNMKFPKGSVVKSRSATGAVKINTPYTVGEARENGLCRLQDGDADVGWVPEDLLEEAEPSLVATFSMTDEQLERVLASRGFSMQAMQQQQQQLGQVSAANRKNHIQQLLFAFNGQVPMDGVTPHPGYRLPPVLIKQIEKTLREAPTALKFAVDMAGASDFDQVVIDLVNAIPEGSRIADKNPKTPRYDVFNLGGGTDEVENDEEDEITDEGIQSLSMTIGR